MAQLDPNIILGAKPVQIDNPVNSLAKMMQLQGLQQEGQMRGLQMQDAQDARTSKNKLAELYATSMGADGQIDRNKLLQGAAQRGLGAQIPGMQKEFAAADEQTGKVGKVKAETEKLQLDQGIKRIEFVSQLLGGVKDQASLDQTRALAQQNGIDLSGLPAQYDPAVIEQRRMQGLQMKDQLEQVWKQKGYDLEVGKFGETQRHNKSTEGLTAQGQQITMRGQNMTDSRARESNALKSREMEMTNAPGSGGAVLGVPVPTVMPWANQSNPKDANKVKAVEQSRGSKEIEKDVDAARKEKEAATAAARFLELNKTTNTGGLTDRMGLTRGLQSLGPEYAEMESITAKLAPAMRVEGSGSTSDFDGKQFERATVGVDKPGKTNANIANGIIARAQQAQEYADFRQTYLEQNGTLQGADRFWKDYANKNPIFDPKKPGSFELNTKRSTWNEHFKGGKPDKTAPAGAGLSAEEAAELADLRKRLGK